MGIFTVVCELQELTRNRPSATIADVMVDTGSEYTWLPDELLREAGVTVTKKDIAFVMANGATITRDIGYAYLRSGAFAERIFINVGARAFVPPFPGVDEVDYLTNSSIMELDALPEHLVIVGGGYIGLEFAQMFRRFGSEVTLIDRGERLIKRESEDVSAAVAAVLEGEGVRLRLDAECLGFERRGAAVAATLECRDQEPEVVGSHLLLAVGRRPNTDDLGLDTTGIKVDGRGHIRVDDALQTSVPGVWALGECNGRGAFTHTAYHDYEIVAGNLLHDDPRRVTDRIDCYALYIDPPLGRVGMPQVRASGRPALIATRPMTRVGRAMEKSETQGFMKVLVDAETERILGAAILGVGGDEIIHSILDVMYADAPYTVIRRAVHIHPTVAELIGKVQLRDRYETAARRDTPPLRRRSRPRRYRSGTSIRSPDRLRKTPSSTR